MSSDPDGVPKPVPRWRSGLAWAITAAVLLATLTPAAWVRALRGGMEGDGGGPPLFGILPFDKLVHFALFAALAAGWTWALPARWSSFSKVLSIVAALSIGTELLQALPIIGRDAGLADGLADLIGGLSVASIFGTIRIVRREAGS
ncbi:MAG: hypothetical protein U0800_03770 [Isosphaeraceae bacterium]